MTDCTLCRDTGRLAERATRAPVLTHRYCVCSKGQVMEAQEAARQADFYAAHCAAIDYADAHMGQPNFEEEAA